MGVWLCGHQVTGCHGAHSWQSHLKKGCCEKRLFLSVLLTVSKESGFYSRALCMHSGDTMFSFSFEGIETSRNVRIVTCILGNKTVKQQFRVLLF